MRTATNNSDIKKVSVQFKEPVTAVKEDLKDAVEQRKIEKSKAISKRGNQTRFASQIQVYGETKDILKEVLKAHRAVKEYIVEVKSKNPALSHEELSALVFHFIDRNKLNDVIIPGCVEAEVHYINKRVNNGRKSDASGPTYLTFLESSFSNKRFTLSSTRRSIFFEDIDIVLRLSRAIPKFKTDEAFHLNLGAIDLEELSDLNLTVFYTAK